MTTNKRDQTLRTGNRYHLPLPTGPYQVIGYYDIMTGTDKSDEVLTRILYPAQNQSIKITDKYKEWPNWFPHYNYRVGFLNVANIFWPPLIKALNSFSPDVFIPILQNVKPLKPSDQKFPVIIFSHGLASCRTTYSSICYELASYGFIVVVLEHRDESACASFSPNDLNNDNCDQFKWISYRHSYTMDNDFKVRNEQLDQRVADVNKALSVLNCLNTGKEIRNLLEPKMETQNFIGLFDFNNIILMGHSFGSSTAIRSLLTIDSIKLAVCLDAWMYPIKEVNASAITKPILFVNMHTFQSKQNLNKMKQFITTDGKNTDIRKVLTVKDAKHTDQSDVPFVMSSLLLRIFRMKSKVDPFLVHDITTALTIDFIVDNLQIELIKNKKDFIEKYSEQLFEGIHSLD